MYSCYGHAAQVYFDLLFFLLRRLKCKKIEQILLKVMFLVLSVVDQGNGVYMAGKVL